MGMYTEYNLRFHIKENTPEEIKQRINSFIQDEKSPVRHEQSYLSCALFGHDILVIHCETKYDYLMKDFLDWVFPYIDAYEKQFLGYYMYEEDTYPTLILYSKDGYGEGKLG